MSDILAGLRVLLLEDEFLIAMDVEQLCLDHGAEEVVVAKHLSEIERDQVAANFDAAILDIVLGGASTLDFARHIRALKMPFIFASGYTELKEIRAAFPGVAIVPKPYSGGDLIGALAVAAGRQLDDRIF